MLLRTLSLSMLFASGSCLAAPPQCAAAALTQAKKLLAFHSDGDDRAAVNTSVKRLPSLSNPANPKQKLTVLEVTGYVYRAEYRMRIVYFPIEGDCVLVGQEILELASL